VFKTIWTFRGFFVSNISPLIDFGKMSRWWQMHRWMRICVKTPTHSKKPVFYSNFLFEFFCQTAAGLELVSDELSGFYEKAFEVFLMGMMCGSVPHANISLRLIWCGNILRRIRRIFYFECRGSKWVWLILVYLEIQFRLIGLSEFALFILVYFWVIFYNTSLPIFLRQFPPIWFLPPNYIPSFVFPILWLHRISFFCCLSAQRNLCGHEIYRLTNVHCWIRVGFLFLIFKRPFGI